MDYNASDDKGEIWIRGPCVSMGYYKDEEKTKEDFDEDNWFHSGDIGSWNDDGTLKIIDRKKNFFKLAQGEYVPAEVLEGLYNKNKYTTQLWIYGDSHERSIVAVGVLNPIIAENLAKELDLEINEDEDLIRELCENQEVKKIILDEMLQIAKNNKRSPFEFVKRIHLHYEEFNTDNDLATPTMKLKRPQLFKYFQEVIQDMYEDIHEEEHRLAKEEALQKKKKRPQTTRPQKNGEEEDNKKKKRPSSARGKKKNDEEDEESNKDKATKKKTKPKDNSNEELSNEDKATKKKTKPKEDNSNEEKPEETNETAKKTKKKAKPSPDEERKSNEEGSKELSEEN